jgi:L-threonylcarbamoyladenylate synthase
MSLYIDFKEKINNDELKMAAETIKNGGLVVFPTETVYGVGCNALDEEAIKRVFEAKNRPLDNPISVLVSSIEMAKTLAKNISEDELKIMKAFMPGPLTIVLEKKDSVSNVLTAGTNTVGIRMPENDLALKLIRYSGVPLATTSANLSGHTSGTNIEMIKSDIGNYVDCFIDGGESEIGIPSTVIKLDGKNIKVLREGTIKEEDLYKVIL